MIILMACIAIGLSVMIFVWHVGSLLIIVPTEDRKYNDQPPGLFRFGWPLIRLFVFYCGGLLSKQYKESCLSKLRRAGYDYALSPEQFFAGKVWAGLMLMLFSVFVARQIEIDSFLTSVIGFFLGYTWPDNWLKKAIKIRENRIFRELPFYLDILTLSVEAGTNITGAFTQAVDKAPPGPLRQELSRMLREIRAGKPRVDALRNLADRVKMQAISSLVSTIIQAERMGSSLSNVLRAQADQRRHERFTKAEKIGMEAPVKLLGPLVTFIFPTTFLVIGFLIFVKLVESEIITNPFILWALNNPQ